MGLQKVNKYSVVGGKKFANYKLCILHWYFRIDWFVIILKLHCNERIPMYSLLLEKKAPIENVEKCNKKEIKNRFC